jgi:hypothetical protein
MRPRSTTSESTRRFLESAPASICSNNLVPVSLFRSAEKKEKLQKKKGGKKGETSGRRLGGRA